MNKKISELTDDEIFKYIYQMENKSCVKRYNERKNFPENDNELAVNITYDNCRYCKEHQDFSICGLDCKEDKTIIDYQAIRTGIYKDDEVEVEEDE